MRDASLPRRVHDPRSTRVHVEGACVDNDLGCGDTSSLCEFIDWVAELGFHLVQVLPINETGGDHSPYNAISSMALDITTLCLHPGTLPEVGLPVEVSLPTNLRLRPGELVNLVIKPAAHPPQHL